MPAQFNNGETVPTKLLPGEPFVNTSGELFVGDELGNPIPLIQPGKSSKNYLMEFHSLSELILHVYPWGGATGEDNHYLKLNYSFNPNYKIYVFYQKSATDYVLKNGHYLYSPMVWIDDLNPNPTQQEMEIFKFHNNLIFDYQIKVDLTSIYSNIIVYYVPDYEKTIECNLFKHSLDKPGLENLIKLQLNNIIDELNLNWLTNNFEATKLTCFWPEFDNTSISLLSQYEKLTIILEDVSTHKFYEFPVNIIPGQSAFKFFLLALPIFKQGVYRFSIGFEFADIKQVSNVSTEFTLGSGAN
jgi:hypothetical protein